jgi:hypothetical protein
MGMVIGVGAASVALAAGAFVGVKALGHEGGPSGPQPTAAGSRTPGAESSPSASASETAPALPGPISIEIGGETRTFTSKAELTEAFRLEMAKEATPQEAGQALLQGFNSVVNFGLNEKDAATFGNYASADGERLGIGALKQDVIIPAYLDAIVGTPAGGAVMESPDAWSKWVTDTAQEVTHRWFTTKDQVPYTYSCEFNTAKGEDGMVFDTGDAANKLEHGTLFVKCTDNLDQTDLGSRQLADGTQGYNSLTSKQAWYVDLQQQGQDRKLVGMQTEDMLQ